MNIDEAVNDFEQWKGIDARKYCSAAIVLANEYLRLTDPTPLTVELIEAELGKPDQRSDHGSCIWKNVNGNEVQYRYDNKLFVNGSSFYWIKTIGELRWLVAKLRGGVS